MSKCQLCRKKIWFYQEDFEVNNERYHMECFKEVVAHKIDPEIDKINNVVAGPPPPFDYNNQYLTGVEPPKYDPLNIYKKQNDELDSLLEKLLQLTKNAKAEGLCLMCYKNKNNPICNECLIQILLSKIQNKG